MSVFLCVFESESHGFADFCQNVFFCFRGAVSE